MFYRLFLFVVCAIVPASTVLANDFTLSAPDYSIAYDHVPRLSLAADIDLDGDNDLVSLSSTRAHYFQNLFVESGARGFALPQQFFYSPSLGLSPIPGIRDAQLKDVNGDGTKDLVIASANRRFLIVVLNENGVFGVPFVYDTGLPNVTSEQEVSIEVVDFDSDGDLDVAMSYRIPKKLVFFWNNGSTAHPLLDFVQAYDLPAGARDIAAGDFDSDGALDLVTASPCGGITSNACLLINAGGLANFSFDPSFDPSLNSNAVSVDDVNQDGFSDIVFALTFAGPNELYRFLGDGTGSFVATTPVPVDDTPDDLQLVDMDLDGQLDYVVAHEGASGQDDSVSVALAAGPELHVFQLESASYATVADLDNDDYPEIIIGGFTPAPYSASHGILWNETPNLYVRADIDGSGALNLADAIGIFNHLFTTAPTTLPEWVFDYNDDGFNTMADGLSVLFYLFTGGPAPAAPFPNPGLDPTP